MGMEHILPVKEGSDVTLYNILEYNQWRCRGTQKDNELFIVYRDEKNEKHVQSIKDPPMEIYFVKPEFRSEFLTPREYYPIENTYSVKVPARTVPYRIYQELKQSQDPIAPQLRKIYENAGATGNSRAKKEVFKWPYTLMSDMSAEDYYWVQCGVHYNLSHPLIFDKCFADIENDIYQRTSVDQMMNMDPVNAVTLIFDYDKNGPNKNLGMKVFTFLLRDHKRYPQQEHLETHLGEFYKKCHECFDEQTVIKKHKKKVIATPAEYKIVFYDSEQDLLAQVFKTINTYKPDLCEFWNMPYDMPKMKARMENLGMNPVEVMSDLDFFPKEVQFAQFNIDNRPIDIANRNSYIRMTSTTQYVDQMQNYAGIRKGRKSYGSNKLDNIAKIELGLGKWEFEKGIDVTNACVKDYWNFVLYNIRDVWCQVLIDIVTNDSMALVYDMNQHNTPLYHLVKQTRYQKQIYYKGYMVRGFVPGNNPNVSYSRYGSEEEQEREEAELKRRKLREALDRMHASLDEDDIEQLLQEGDPEDLDLELITDGSIVSNDDDDSESNELNEMLDAESVEAYNDAVEIYKDSIARKLPLQGGMVGNPDNNLAVGVELIDGIPSKHVVDDTMDMDYSSEYPWAKYTRSLSKSTQIGRLIIPHRVSKYQNVLPLGQQKRAKDIKKYIPGAEFTGDYMSQCYLSFGAVWFNLPLTDECGKLVDKMLAGEKIDWEGEDHD